MNFTNQLKEKIEDIFIFIYEYSIFYWVILFFNDLKLLVKFRNAVIDSLNYINERIKNEKSHLQPLRISLDGRLYTVVNLKEETIEMANDYVKESDVYQTIVEYNDILWDIGLSHYCYPYIKSLPENEEVTTAYLVFLYPIYKSFSFSYFLLVLLETFIFYVFIKIFIEYNLHIKLWEFLNQILKIIF